MSEELEARIRMLESKINEYGPDFDRRISALEAAYAGTLEETERGWVKLWHEQFDAFLQKLVPIIDERIMASQRGEEPQQ